MFELPVPFPFHGIFLDFSSFYYKLYSMLSESTYYIIPATIPTTITTAMTILEIAIAAVLFCLCVVTADVVTTSSPVELTGRVTLTSEVVMGLVVICPEVI